MDSLKQWEEPLIESSSQQTWEVQPRQARALRGCCVQRRGSSQVGLWGPQVIQGTAPVRAVHAANSAIHEGSLEGQGVFLLLTGLVSAPGVQPPLADTTVTIQRAETHQSYLRLCAKPQSDAVMSTDSRLRQRVCIDSSTREGSCSIAGGKCFDESL